MPKACQRLNCSMPLPPVLYISIHIILIVSIYYPQVILLLILYRIQLALCTHISQNYIQPGSSIKKPHFSKVRATTGGMYIIHIYISLHFYKFALTSLGGLELCSFSIHLTAEPGSLSRDKQKVELCGALLHFFDARPLCLGARRP